MKAIESIKIAIEELRNGPKTPFTESAIAALQLALDNAVYGVSWLEKLPPAEK
jgi:hypothetical protein